MTYINWLLLALKVQDEYFVWAACFKKSNVFVYKLTFYTYSIDLKEQIKLKKKIHSKSSTQLIENIFRNLVRLLSESQTKYTCKNFFIVIRDDIFCKTIEPFWQLQYFLKNLLFDSFHTHFFVYNFKSYIRK